MSRTRWCPICELPIKRGQETEKLACGHPCHKICFDIVCTGLAADIDVVFDAEGNYKDPWQK